jgi:dienelactone hydrolase
VALSSGDATPFKAVAQVHPAMLDPEDAKKVTVPICTLASKDEDPNDVSGFNANLNVQSYVETFEDQIHGWMGTRADLDDPNVREKYKSGYQTVLDFFGRQM